MKRIACLLISLLLLASFASAETNMPPTVSSLGYSLVYPDETWQMLSPDTIDAFSEKVGVIGSSLLEMLGLGNDYIDDYENRLVDIVFYEKSFTHGGNMIMRPLTTVDPTQVSLSGLGLALWSELRPLLKLYNINVMREAEKRVIGEHSFITFGFETQDGKITYQYITENDVTNQFLNFTFTTFTPEQIEPILTTLEFH